MTLQQGAGRWAWAEIDLGAIRHNVARLRQRAAPAALWAVVKADGYGHGAVAVATAALDAGAEGLCVALASEGAALRETGIAAPILVLSEQPPTLAAAIVRYDLTPTVVTAEGVLALGGAARVAGRTLDVHLKVDTGMHRTGAGPAGVSDLVDLIDRTDGVRLTGVFTHMAVADEPDRPETAAQLQCLDAVLAELGRRGVGDQILVHAANSAATLAHPAARRSLVRVGIAMYGIAPGPAVTDPELRPALALKSRVALVKRLAAGARLSYGLRHTLAGDTTVATVPIGYADGVRRGLGGTGTTVLVGGRRCPIVGTITMDQLLVDVGDAPVAVGDEVVLIGRQGDEEIRAEEWAATLGTIGYEIVCGIGPRVPRRVLQ